MDEGKHLESGAHDGRTGEGFGIPGNLQRNE